MSRLRRQKYDQSRFFVGLKLAEVDENVVRVSSGFARGLLDLLLHLTLSIVNNLL